MCDEVMKYPLAVGGAVLYVLGVFRTTLCSHTREGLGLLL